MQHAADVERSPVTRILLVDDDVLALTMLANGLRQCGYDVDEAPSAEIALRHIERTQPDLAILDIRMPGMSGIDLASRLHAHSNVPVLFLSAYSDEELVEQAIAERPVGYIVKPVDAQHIVPQIEAALATSQNLKRSEQQSANLNQALRARRTVSIAVGILMTRTQTDRDTAFEVLRKVARDSNRKIEDVAETVLGATETLNEFRRVAATLSQR